MDFATMIAQMQVNAAYLVGLYGWIPITLLLSAIIMLIFIIVVVLFTINETDTVARRKAKRTGYVCRLQKVK